MFLIVGLGNPGAEYAGTRHNTGFMAADFLHRKFGFAPFRDKFDGEIAEGKIGAEKVYLLKPQTFMNCSGNSVVKAAHFYKILPQNIIVIHDDMDLPVGKIKAKLGGGAGGHNGLKSIDAAITPDYNRIRIGVGHPQGDSKAVVDYVLTHFSKADEQIIYDEFEVVAGLIDVLMKDGIAAFCSKLGEAMRVK